MKKSWLSLCVMLLITLSACDETTTTLEEGSTFIKEGFIKGSVTTTRSNGMPVTFDFNHEYREGPTAMGTYINFYRYASFEGAWWGNGYSAVRFYLDSTKDVTPDFYNFRMQDETVMSNDSTFYFYVNTYNDLEFTFTNYTYDPATSTISGEFTVTTSSTSNGHEATITGSFSVKVTNYVYKPSNATKE